MQTAKQFLVSGRVQGVGFRARARQCARDLGCAGWVRNRDDGAVEGLAQGSEQAVAEFVRWLQQGPPMGRVDNLQLQQAAIDEKLVGFSIRH